jgi:hypothetical protein
VGGREELQIRRGSLSSEGANREVQAEKSTPIKNLRSLEYNNAFIYNADTTFHITTAAHFHGKRYTRIVKSPYLHQQLAYSTQCALRIRAPRANQLSKRVYQDIPQKRTSEEPKPARDLACVNWHHNTIHFFTCALGLL